MVFIKNDILQFKNSQTDKIILECEYNFWGIIKPNNILIWANSIPLSFKKFQKNTINMLKKKSIFKEAYEKTNIKDLYFYFTILDNNMSLIPNDDYIEKINKMILYLNEDLFIFNPINSKNNIQLITIKKILKKYI